MTARPYQEKALEEIREALRKYRRVLFQSPTGSGKGWMLGYMAASSQKYGRRVLILSSRTEILKQNLRYVENFDKVADFINPKVRKVPTANIVVGMAQTLRRRVDKPEWVEYLRSVDFLFIDEAQECVSDFIHQHLKEDCFVLGLSASPQRYGKMAQLGSFYRAIVTGVSVKELMDLQFLSRPHLYSISAPKLDIPIDYSRGDYNQKALASRFESPILYKGVVSEYLRLTPGKKAICFCVSSTQAIEVTKEFNAFGVSAKYLLSGSFEDDQMYSDSRSDLMDDFKANKFTVLVNVGCCCAGLDIPDIEVCIANFATMSLVKWMQCMGRTARVTDTKHDFYILDCGANYTRLGKYEDDRIFSLWHDTGGSGVQALKECDHTRNDINGKMGCGELVPNTCKVCPACGWVFPTEQHEFIMHLEEVAESDSGKIGPWAAQKKLEGWKLSRIMVQVCLRNPDNAKASFTEAYLALYPGKTEFDASKYWFVFRKQVWDKVKKKKDDSPKLI